MSRPTGFGNSSAMNVTGMSGATSMFGGLSEGAASAYKQVLAQIYQGTQDVMNQLDAQGGEDKDGTVRDRIDAVLQMVQDLAMRDDGEQDEATYDEFGEKILNAPNAKMKAKNAIVEEATEIVQ